MRPVVVIDKIMETASRLFFEQGYNLTGIQQILEESGVSRPSLYNHFPSKNDLLLAYLGDLKIRWFGGLEEFIKELREPKERLLGIFDYRIDRQIRSDFGGCAWTKISAEAPKDNTAVFQRVAEFKALLKQYILELIKRLGRPLGGVLSDELLSENVFLLLEGAQVQACVNRNTEALQNAREIVERLIGL